MADIYQIIHDIQVAAGALAPAEPSHKPGEKGLGFAFRGINDVTNKLAPLFKEHGLLVYPEVVHNETTAREIGTRALTQSEVVTRTHFVALSDGSELVATTAGLAQDFSDRSAAQAQSVAFRTALLQTFFLPTADDEPEIAGLKNEQILDQIDRENATAARQAPQAAPKDTNRVAELRETIKGIVESGGVVKDNGEVVAVDRTALNKFGDDLNNGSKAWKGNESILSKVVEATLAGQFSPEA